jgi:hypothetical protein
MVAGFDDFGKLGDGERLDIVRFDVMRRLDMPCGVVISPAPVRAEAAELAQELEFLRGRDRLQGASRAEAVEKIGIQFSHGIDIPGLAEILQMSNRVAVFSDR